MHEVLLRGELGLSVASGLQLYLPVRVCGGSMWENHGTSEQEIE
jgi:hypothetical protein